MHGVEAGVAYVEQDGRKPQAGEPVGDALVEGRLTTMSPSSRPVTGRLASRGDALSAADS
ncbi:hypothetical protein ACFQYP_11760 [Nonomuraea antimicrobica]